MDLIKRITKRGVVALIFCAGLSAVVEWKKLPASILIGGILGIANIRGLSWSVEGLLGTYRATGKMIFFSIFRLVILCIIIAALVSLKLVNIFGILIGFTVIFSLLIMEGLKYAEKMHTDDRP
jgi:hypothetical protein